MVDHDILLRVLEAKTARHAEVTELLQDQVVLANPNRLKTLSRELGQLAPFSRVREKIVSRLSGLADARELAAEDDDEMKELAQAEIEECETALKSLWTQSENLLAEDDELGGRDVILEIRGGVGGDEAALFAGDLFTMYRHYCQAHKLKIEVVEESAGDMGGYKEIVLEVSGRDAYKLLRHEGGGHRVQRVPKTESQGRIHTSAATVAVLPKPEALDVAIDWEKDVREDKMRAGGPGGQKVNKTESAIRLVHLETGLQVHIQDEKSQHKNRSKARTVLAARVFDHFHRQALAKQAALKKGMIGSGDRSARIRTYNFPQNRVTDHRHTGHTSHRLEQILLGELDEFRAFMVQAEKEERLAALAREWEERDRDPSK